MKGSKKYFFSFVGFLCLVVVFIYSFLFFKGKEPVELDNVKLEVTPNKRNNLAIMVETSNGEYENYMEDNWPEGYVFNTDLSGCMNSSGVKMEKDTLTFDNEKKEATVKTSATASCYLYFDKGAGLEIIDKKPKGLNLTTTSSSNDWTGMYRFQGQQADGVDNYICFGTTENCSTSNDTRDKYMYRIIGIEENGRVKLIKKEALEKTDQWWTDYNTSKHWTDSKVYTDINGTTFLDNTTYVPKGWEDKIDTNHWLFGSMHSNNQTQGARQSGVELYKLETGQKAAMWDEKAESAEETYKGTKAQSYATTAGDHIGTVYYYIRHNEKWTNTTLRHEVDAKIGLINLSDYYLSVSNTTNCQYDNHTYENVCNTGWMHLSQNDTNNPPSPHEWTMSRYGWGLGDGRFYAYSVNSTGYTHNTTMSYALSVRPVFYLESYVELNGGSGTINDPFMLK